MPGQGSGKTPLSEAQGCRFLVVVQFGPADALLSPEPGGDQGTLFARNVVPGYVRACVSSFMFLCVVLVPLCFSAEHVPTRGAVGAATFHPGYLSFLRLTPAMPMARERFSALLLPCVSTCVPLHIDEGSPRHSNFSVVGLP